VPTLRAEGRGEVAGQDLLPLEVRIARVHRAHLDRVEEERGVELVRLGDGERLGEVLDQVHDPEVRRQLQLRPCPGSSASHITRLAIASKTSSGR
jgi:hypothetical protein